ncbi:MAG: energy transducer TonB, partial [Burkholderiales bacterium]|nr:energy transducer TonB [Burkholderiales bacterium]
MSMARMAPPAAPSAPPPLLARLVEVAPPGEMVKNTLKPERPAAAKARTPAPPAGRGAPASALEAAQARLHEHVFYPPAAVEQGLEGEAIVLLEIDAEGRVLGASIASSSGHAMLDDAALQAVRRIDRLPAGGTAAALLLPVR